MSCLRWIQEIRNRKTARFRCTQLWDRPPPSVTFDLLLSGPLGPLASHKASKKWHLLRAYSICSWSFRHGSYPPTAAGKGIPLSEPYESHQWANKGLPLPLGRGVCETKSKNGRSRPRKPFISRVFCARRGIETMVSDHGLGRGQTMG